MERRTCGRSIRTFRDCRRRKVFQRLAQSVERKKKKKMSNRIVKWSVKWKLNPSYRSLASAKNDLVRIVAFRVLDYETRITNAQTRPLGNLRVRRPHLDFMAILR